MEKCNTEQLAPWAELPPSTTTTYTFVWVIGYSSPHVNGMPWGEWVAKYASTREIVEAGEVYADEKDRQRQDPTSSYSHWLEWKANQY